MPRFEIRLQASKAKDSEFRVVRLTAEDRDAAVAAVERNEYQLAAWQADPERLDELHSALDAHESDDPKVALTGLDRAHWFIHHQAKPYIVVDVAELEER